MQRVQVDALDCRLPVDNCFIVDVFAASEVRFEQLAVDFAEAASLRRAHSAAAKDLWPFGIHVG